MGDKHIRLTYEPDRPDGPWFMSTGPTKFPKGKGKYDAVKVDKYEKGTLIFKIETEGIEFSDPAIQISVAPGQPQGGDIDQFIPTFINEKGDPIQPNEPKDTLKVEDLNRDSQPTNYYYQLNFKDKPSLDPIIQNGCCRPFPIVVPEQNMNLVAETNVIAALLLAAVVIVLVAVRMRRAVA